MHRENKASDSHPAMQGRAIPARGIVIFFIALFALAPPAWGKKSNHSNDSDMAECTLVRTSGTPLSYRPTSAWGGATGAIRRHGALESRLVRLAQAYTLEFSCHGTGSVDLEIIAIDITAPDFFSADDLDLIDGDRAGVTHLVDVSINGDTLITDEAFNEGNMTIVDPDAGGEGEDLVLYGSSQGGNQGQGQGHGYGYGHCKNRGRGHDGDDDDDGRGQGKGHNRDDECQGALVVDITSTYVVTGGAEEMAAGDYRTLIETRVTPADGGLVASDRTVIRGSVDPECSLDTESLSMRTGQPVTYAATTSLGNAHVPAGRVLRLQAADSVGFDCNTDNFSYAVEMTDLKAPRFIQAGNLGLIDSPGDVGVDHKAGVTLRFPRGGRPDERVLDVAGDSALETGILVSDTDLGLDADGDVAVEVASRFEAVDAAEELGAGEYGASFTVTVTAQ